MGELLARVRAMLRRKSNFSQPNLCCGNLTLDRSGYDLSTPGHDKIRLSGKTSVVITCDPDNMPSRKTCNRLGCLFERIAEVPEDIYRKFEISRQKCRYIWHIAGAEEND